VTGPVVRASLARSVPFLMVVVLLVRLRDAATY
jgi:hypothetical protein